MSRKEGGEIMREEHMDFGQFIRSKRLKDSRELTLRDISKELGISLSMLSDIEKGRRNPFDAEKIEKFCEFLNLPEKDKEHIYDLAAKKRGDIPEDIDDIMMYTDIGYMARCALRMSNKGILKKKDWEDFIRKAERQEKNE